MKLRRLLLVVSALVVGTTSFAGIEYIIAHEKSDLWPMTGALICWPAKEGQSPFAKQTVRFSFDPSKLEGPEFGRLTSVELVLFRPADEKERKKREILQPTGRAMPAPIFANTDKHLVWMSGIEWLEPLEMTPREFVREVSYDEFLRLAVLVRFELKEEGHSTQKRIVYLISEFKRGADENLSADTASPAIPVEAHH